MSEELIKKAVVLFRTGEMEQARRILKDVLKDEPKNEKAWLWFLQTFDGVDAKIKAVQLWIKVDQESRTAREILNKLLDQPVPGFEKRETADQIPQKVGLKPGDKSKSVRNKPWVIPSFLILLIIVCFSLFYFLDQTIGVGFLPNVFDSSADCKCTETDAYMLHLQDRVERWNINRTIMVFAELQGDNSKSVQQLQKLFDEETNDAVPGCLEDVHEIFLSLLDLHIKYLQAVDDNDEFGTNKYDLSVQIKLDELQTELERISIDFVCSTDQ